MRFAKKFIVASACLAFVAPFASALAATKPAIQHFQFTNVVDPVASEDLSAACGVPIQDSDSGVITVITDDSGRQLILQSLVSTFTNTKTGVSVTIRLVVQVTTALIQLDGNGSFTFEAVFRGLNFLYKDEGGTFVAAGRADTTFTVIFDRKGRVTSVSYQEDLTPNLMHWTDFFCARLGGTPP